MPHWRTIFGREKGMIPSIPDPEEDQAVKAPDPILDEPQEHPAPPLLIKGRTPSGRIMTKKHNDKLVQQFYKRYQLKWPKLRDWLAAKFPEDEFPGVEFKQGFDATKEYYEFWVPRKLTEVEFAEIKKLREDA